MFDKLEINVLTYKRPIHFFVTVISLRLLLGRESGRVKLNVFLQELNHFKKLLIGSLFPNCTIYVSNKNVGMLAGWQYLSSISERPIVFLLEDDWIALKNIKKSLKISLQAIIAGELDFVKLRLINDFDDYGFGKIDSCPWTLNGCENLYSEREDYFLTDNKTVNFTFNPSLMPTSLFKTLVSELLDDESDPTPLRSGENQVITRWRLLHKLKVGQLKHGCFSHIGFHSRRHYVTRLPQIIYLLYKGTKHWKKS